MSRRIGVVLSTEVGFDTFGLTAAILAIAGVVAFLAHRARQPLIIAFILVGIMRGVPVNVRFAGALYRIFAP